MKNLKLSLKKEVISSLEAKNVVGGRPTIPTVTPLTMYAEGEEPCNPNTVITCPGTAGCGGGGTATKGCISIDPMACLMSLPGDATCWECR